MTITGPVSQNPPRTGIPAYMLMILSGLFGGVSLVLFGAFLYTGLPSQINLDLKDSMDLCINTLLCLLFFLQHSLMLRKGIRHRLSAMIPSHYFGAVFSIFSGLFLVLLMLFWQKSTSIQIEFIGAGRWAMRFLFFIAMIGSYITIRSLRPFDPLGIRDISAHLRGDPPNGQSFTVRGPYRWVRHPVYFFSLLIIWASPSLTTDRLLFNGLWTAWIIIGMILEERDLIVTFGEAYRNYQNRVPMLIPYKWASRH